MGLLEATNNRHNGLSGAFRMKPLKCVACFTVTLLLLASQPAPACEDHAKASGSKHSCEGGASCKHHKEASADAKAVTPVSTTASATTAKADGQSYELNVDGMHCQSCVDNLKAELEKMSDVVKDSLKVDLKGKKATVTLVKGSKSTASVDSLKKSLNDALTKSGYTVTAVKVVN